MRSDHSLWRTIMLNFIAIFVGEVYKGQLPEPVEHQLQPSVILSDDVNENDTITTADFTPRRSERIANQKKTASNLLSDDLTQIDLTD